MDIKEELKSAGAYPSGPCSAWPIERNQYLHDKLLKRKGAQPSIKADAKAMAGGLLKTAGQALRHGRVSAEIRNERRPNSRYSSLAQCQKEVSWAENFFRRHQIPFIDTTSISIEEIAVSILHRFGLTRESY